MPDIDPDHPIWQRNYYDHFLRDAANLARIQTYIACNPARWSDDALYTL